MLENRDIFVVKVQCCGREVIQTFETKHKVINENKAST